MFPGLRMLTGRPLDLAFMHICSATHLLCPYPSDSSFHISFMSADSINVFVSAVLIQKKYTGIYTLVRFRKWKISTPRTDDLHDLYDLYDLYDLHDLYDLFPLHDVCISGGPYLHSIAHVTG